MHCCFHAMHYSRHPYRAREPLPPPPLRARQSPPPPRARQPPPPPRARQPPPPPAPKSVYIDNLPYSVSDTRLREFLGVDDSVNITTVQPENNDNFRVRRVLTFQSVSQAAYVVTLHNFRLIDGHILRMEVSPDWESSAGGVIKLQQRSPLSIDEIYHHFNQSSPVVTVVRHKKRSKYTILFNTDADGRKALRDNRNYKNQDIFPLSETISLHLIESPKHRLFSAPPPTSHQPIPITIPSSNKAVSLDIRDPGSNPKVFGTPSVRQGAFKPSHASAAGVSIIPSVRPATSTTAPGSVPYATMTLLKKINQVTGAGSSSGGSRGAGGGGGEGGASRSGNDLRQTLQSLPLKKDLVFECHHTSKLLEPAMDNEALPYCGKTKYTAPFCAGNTLPRKCGNHGDRTRWCKGAFLSYESLHNLSSASEEGDVAVSTLAWGSQLDISTITLNYGLEYRQKGKSREDPPTALVSALSVTMDRYGDRDSACELLAAYESGELPRSSSALNEIANVKHPGPILQMKCVESGHLVTLTTKAMHVWDSELQQDQSVPLITLGDTNRQYTQIDTKRSTLYAATNYGLLSTWDLTKAVSVADYQMTDQDVSQTRINVPKWDTCRISVNPYRDMLLVGSPNCAYVALWDIRSTANSQLEFTNMTITGSRGAYRRDPVFDCEWNPQDGNTFMTTHPQMIRIWDLRNTKTSADQIEVNYGLANVLFRARWSPHHRNLIAGLLRDGQLRIWCTDTNSKPGSRKEDDKHELLFVHGGHQLAVSDFAWCPYMEDTIASVAPSTESQAGEIQVWRPRNFLDDPDNMDP